MQRSKILCACDCGLTTLYGRGNKPRKFVAGHESGNFSPNKKRNGNKTHGMTGTVEYCAYANAKRRCNTDPEFPCFSSYYGRGIRFEFKNFEEFYAELGPRPSPEHSVDRIDPTGNYCKGNVRWATRDVQMANRRGQWYLWREELISLDNGYPEEIGFKWHAQWVCPVNAGFATTEP